MAENFLKNELDIHVHSVRDIEAKLSGLDNDDFQKKLKALISALEKLTVAASQLNMFSENESIEDLATSNIRFLMLPALLACCTDKLKTENRKANLECVEIYIKDFIGRLKNYGILPASSQEFDLTATSSSQMADPSVMPTAEYLKIATKTREEKVKMYREQKEYQEKYHTMLEKLEDCSDEDQLREFYILELNYWARKLYEMLCVVQREKSIIEHMDKIQSGEIQPQPKERPPPQKPFILTRSKLQKEVFGLGYPSIPTVSLDEFYEQQTKDGNLQMLSNKNQQYDPDGKNAAKDEASDKDDSSLLQSERDFDEYKDEHRSGWGNTYNKG